MNLTQLKYFQTVCRYGSITSAVEELGVSQPSVSSAIRALEEELGVPFFERQHRGMAPTEEGKQFLLLADSLLEHAAQVEQVMQEVSSQRRSLRIGMTPLVGSVVMPQIYESFFRENPAIRFRIREAAQDELFSQLASDRQDVIIVPHIDPLEKEFRTIPVLQMRMACCLAPGHPLAAKKSIRIEEVKDERLILFQETSVQSRAVTARFAEQGLTPNILLYTEQLTTLEHFVSRNLAVGFLYSNFAENAPGMTGVPLDPPITAQVSVVWREGGYQFEEREKFLRFCRRFSFRKG